MPQGKTNAKEKKAGFTAADKIYNRIFWDDQLNPDDWEVGYEDRFKGLMYMPIRNWRTGEDETKEIPFHRIRTFRCQGHVVWNRTARFNLVDKIAQGISPNEAVLAFVPKEHQPLMSVVRPGAWNETTEAWEPVSSAQHQLPDSPTSELTNATLQIITYNILCDQFHANAIHTKHRTPMLLQELQTADAGIVALEEVTVEVLNCLLADPWVRKTYQISDITAESITPQGQVILSKYPFTSVFLHNFSQNKRAVFAKVLLVGVEVAVCCVHLVSDFASDAVEKRKSQLCQIFQELEGFDHAILLGDFNFGDEADEQTSADWGQYLDIWKALNPTQAGHTFDVQGNTLADITALFHRYPRRLDRVLLRSMDFMKAKKISLIGNVSHSVKTMVPQLNEVGDMIGQKLKEVELFPSDHYGLLCEIKLDEKYASTYKRPTSPTTTTSGGGTSSGGNSGPPPKISTVMKTALCIIPPTSLWSHINKIREKYDKSISRWPPHINILWPFVSQTLFGVFTAALWQVAKEMQPFKLKLRTMLYFENQEAVLYLLPESDEREIDRLHSQLCEAMPMCKSKHDYTPHMSIGQFSKEEVKKYQKELQQSWKDLEFTVSELHMIAREDEDDIFKIVHSVQLGNMDTPKYPSPSTHFPTIRCKPSTMMSDVEGGYSSTDSAYQDVEQSGMDISKMVMDKVLWGKKKLPTYYPQDRLEQWLLCNTQPELARNLPTHISQLGAMYHIHSNKLDEYLEAWAQSIAANSTQPFYVEEVRGDLFRLYLDIDIKMTIHEQFDLIESGWLYVILMHTYVFFKNEENCDVVVTQCHGKWSDQLDKDAQFKSGYRLFFDNIWVDLRTYVTFVKTLCATMMKCFNTPYRGTPKKSGWKDIIDVKSVEWDRGRLHGTIKRRRNLQRIYTLFGKYGFQAPPTLLEWVSSSMKMLPAATAEIMCPASDGSIKGGLVKKEEETEQLNKDITALLFATTIRMWDLSESKFSGYTPTYHCMENVNREYSSSRMPNW